MLSGDFTLRCHQRDHILELIAEPVGTASLIERRARPHPTRQRLVGEPTIEHDVHRAVGCPYLDSALGIVPIACNAAQNCIVVGRSSASNQFGRRRRIVGLAEQNHNLGLRPAGNLDAGLQGGARVEAGTRCSQEPVSAVEACWSIWSGITAEELGSIGRPGSLASAEVEERDPAGELGVPRIADQDRLSFSVQRRDNPGSAGTARGAQHPFSVGGHRQAPEAT